MTLAFYRAPRTVSFARRCGLTQSYWGVGSAAGSCFYPHGEPGSVLWLLGSSKLPRKVWSSPELFGLSAVRSDRPLEARSYRDGYAFYCKPAGDQQRSFYSILLLPDRPSRLGSCARSPWTRQGQGSANRFEWVQARSFKLDIYEFESFQGAQGMATFHWQTFNETLERTNNRILGRTAPAMFSSTNVRCRESITR